MPDIYVAPPKKATKKQSDPEKVAASTHEASKATKKKRSKVLVGKPTRNPLAAFVARPANIRFATQEQKEEIILLLRRHWVTNVPWVLLACLLVVAPRLLRFFPLFEFLPPRYQVVSLIVWYLLTTAFIFEKFLTWFFNVNIITDERIVDIDFPSLLYRDVTSTKIEQAQDVSVKVGGFVRSLFDYGDVHIQTAGAVPEICFEAVPRPGRVARILNDLVLEEEKEKLEGRVR